MHTFVVIATTDGSPVDPEIVQRIDQTDLPDLAFAPEEYLRWSNAAGNVHYSGWQAFTDIIEAGSHWQVDEGSLTAFTGHPFPRETGWTDGNQSWASQLKDYLKGRSPLELEEELFGIFSVFTIPRDGTGYLVTDLTSMSVLYTAEVGRHLIVSTRAAVAARAAAKPGTIPARDLYGSGWIPYSQIPFSLDTGFADIKAIPFSSHVLLDPLRGAKIVERSTPYWEFPRTIAIEPSEESLGAYLEAELRAGIRALANMPTASRQVRLSGGRDSRLVTALIMQEGLLNEFEFFSFGLENTPDVIAARNIAERFNLRWEFELRDSAQEREFENPQLINAFQISGGRTGWDAKGQLRASSGMTLSGNMSELFRIGPAAASTLEATSFEEAVQMMANNHQADISRVMKPEIREHYANQFINWIYQRHAEGVDYTRLGSLVMPEFNGRRLYGGGSEVMTRMWVYPLYSPAAARVAQALPPDRRFTQRFHFDIITRASPDLAKLPFVNRSWNPNVLKHLAHPEEYENLPVIKDSSMGARHWRAVQFEAHRPIFKQYLLDQANPIYQLVNFQKIESILNTEQIDGGTLRSLYDVFSTALWLGGHELPARINRTGALDFYQPDSVSQPPGYLLEITGPPPIAHGPTINVAVSEDQDSSARSLALVVSNFPVPSQTFIVNKYLQLLARGWDVHVIALNRDKEHWELYPEIADEPILRNRIHTGQSVPFMLRQLRPQLVNFEFGDLALGNLETVAEIGARSIVGFRGYDICYQGLSRAGFYRPVWEQADALMLRSDDLWLRARQRGCPPDKLRAIIPGAVDSLYFDPGDKAHVEATGSAERPFNILSVGRLVWKKGYEIALQAIRCLVDDGINAHLTIIGNGNLYTNVEYTIFDLGLDEHVTLLGAQGRDRVYEELLAADAFLQTSLSEGFGISVLEAQAMQLPAVVSDAEGLPQNVAHGETGYVVPKRDPIIASECLKRLALDPELRQELGMRGRERAISQFDPDREIDAFEALYLDVLDRPLQAHRLYHALKIHPDVPVDPDFGVYLQMEQEFGDWAGLEDSRAIAT